MLISADKATSDPRRGSAFSNRSNIPPKPSVGAPSSTSRPSLKRKSPSASTSVTESSEDEIKPDGSPTPHKRPKLSPTPQPISKRANSTASKQQTRESESTDTSQSGSEEESETGSENGSHESSQSGNDEERPQATSKKSMYGHLRRHTLRDMTKSLQPSTIPPAIRTTSRFRARNHLLACFG